MSDEPPTGETAAGETAAGEAAAGETAAGEAAAGETGAGEAPVAPVARPPRLTPHRIVEALVHDPAEPPTLVTLKGFVGESSEEDCFRLYLDEELSRWFEVPKPKIVHFEDLPSGPEGLGMTILWLNHEAPEANGHQRHKFP